MILKFKTRIKPKAAGGYYTSTTTGGAGGGHTHPDVAFLNSLTLTDGVLESDGEDIAVAQAAHSYTADQATTAQLADSANKLNTARKLWGNNFNGTADITDSIRVRAVSGNTGLYGSTMGVRCDSDNNVGMMLNAGNFEYGHYLDNTGVTRYWMGDGTTQTQIGSSVIAQAANVPQYGIYPYFSYNIPFIFTELCADGPIYFDRKRTKYLRYDSTLGALVTNLPIMSEKDITAFKDND